MRGESRFYWSIVGRVENNAQPVSLPAKSNLTAGGIGAPGKLVRPKFSKGAVALAGRRLQTLAPHCSWRALTSPSRPSLACLRRIGASTAATCISCCSISGGRGSFINEPAVKHMTKHS